MKTPEDILFEMGYRTRKFGIGDRVTGNVVAKSSMPVLTSLKPLEGGEITLIEHFMGKRTYRITWYNFYNTASRSVCYREEELQENIEKNGWRVSPNGRER